MTWFSLLAISLRIRSTFLIVMVLGQILVVPVGATRPNIRRIAAWFARETELGFPLRAPSAAVIPARRTDSHPICSTLHAIVFASKHFAQAADYEVSVHSPALPDMASLLKRVLGTRSAVVG